MKLRVRHTAVAVVALGLLAGCAQAVTPVGEPAGPAGQISPQETLSSLLDQVYGTEQQRRAGEERMWLTTQSAIAACAAGKGVVYGVSPFQPMLPATEPAPGDLLGFAPQRSDFRVAARIEMLAKRGETANPGLPRDDDAQKSWFAAVESCQGAASSGESTAVPDGQEELENKLVQVLARVQQEQAPDLANRYASCMKSAGIEAADLAEAYLKVEQAFPPVSYEQPSDPTTLPEWAGAVAFEKKVAATDWACRQSDVDTVVTAAADDLQQFKTSNTPLVTQVAAGWAAMPPLAQQLRTRVTITGK